MKVISPSGLAKSGGCGKLLNHSCKRYTPKENFSDDVDDKQNENQRAGTIIHNIVQHVFVGEDSSRREERYQKVIKATEETQYSGKIANYILEIDANKNCLRNQSYQIIREKIWEEVPTLLSIIEKILRILEKKNEGSKGKWKITAEKGNEEDNMRDLMGVELTILKQKMLVDCSIDLIFEYKHIIYIGEIKSGKVDDSNMHKWKLQVQLMMETWKKKYSQDDVKGIIINSNLEKGFEIIKNTPLIEKLKTKDDEYLRAGYQCRSCEFESKCDMSIQA